MNFSTSLSLACQSKDNLNSGGCSGGVASWSLYRDTDGDPSIGDVFYRYSDKCTPFTFLNGYGIIEGSTEFILLNFTNGVVTEIVDCSSLPTPTETSTPTPTNTPTVTPTIGCTLPHPETSTVFESCGGENFADSLSWACQMKDTFNSGGGCTGGTSYRTLYRDGSGVPSIGDPFYRYQNTCEVFTFLNGYSVLSTTDGYVVVNTLNGIVIGIENCSSLPTPTETSTPTPTESSTPIPTSTETPLPTATTLISSITLAYNYSLGMGSLSFSGMTTNELGDATCNSLAANYQTQTYYGDTLGLGTQFTNGNNIHSNQFWVTNQYYGTLQGPLWVVGSTEYIIETDVNGVVVRYEPFIVQCTPTPTPTNTPTPTPTVTFPIIQFFQVNNNANDLSVIRVEGPANTFGTSTAWGDIYELQFNRQVVLGPNTENVYGIIPYNAGVIDLESLWQSLTTSSTIELVGMPSNPYNPSAGYNSTGNSVKIQLTSAPSYNGSIATIRNFTIVESNGFGLEMGRVYQFIVTV